MCHEVKVKLANHGNTFCQDCFLLLQLLHFIALVWSLLLQIARFSQIHLRTAPTERNSPLENNSIKGRCDNHSESKPLHAIVQNWTLLSLMNSCYYGV